MSKIKLAILIDDETIDQRQYARVLRKSGQVEEIMSFNYADEALAFLVANPDLEVDVIFLDINMPRMNGFEFLAEAQAALGSNYTKLLVVMLTTSLAPEDKERASEFDVVKRYFNKPLTLDHVQEVLGVLSQAEEGSEESRPSDREYEQLADQDNSQQNARP